MRFICNSQILSKAVNVVSKASAPKSVNPILEGILIRAKENTLTFTGNNLDMAIETKIEADVKEEGEIVLNCSMLLDILRRLPLSDADFKMDEKRAVSIDCQNASYKIVGLDAKEFPEIPKIDVSSEITIKEQDLKDVINKTLFAVALTDVRPTLTGSLFEVEDNVLNVVSLDGFRLAFKKIRVEKTQEQGKFIIPGKTQNELLKLLGDSEEEEIKIGFSKNHAIIKSENYTVVTRLIEGEFWAYKRNIPTEFNFEITLDTKEFLKSLERTEPIIEDYSKNPVVISLSEGEIKINCQTRLGMVNDYINCNYSGEYMEAGFNLKYLLDAVKNCQTEHLDFKGNSPTSPFIIIPKEDEDILYLVVPARIK